MGGRKISPILLGLSFWALMGGAWAFIGGPGIAYSYGFIEFANFTAWIPGVAIVALLLAPIIRKRGEEFGAKSFSGFITEAHGGGYPLRALASSLTVFAYLIFLIGSVKAVGVTLSSSLGLPFIAAAIFGCLVILIYSLTGGFRAVILTDVIGCIFLFIIFGGIIALVFMHGGFESVIAQTEASFPELLHPPTGEPYARTFAGAWISFALIYVFWQLLPENWQYYLALSKTSKKDIAIFTAISAISVALIPYIIFGGILGRLYLPPLSDPDTVMPELFKTFFHPVVYGFFTIGLFTAVMTTTDSYLIAVSANIDELLDPIYKKFRMGEGSRMKIARVTMAVFWVICVFLGVISPPHLMVKFFALSTMGLCGIIAGPTLFYFVRKGTKNAAFYSLIISTVVLLGINFSGLVGWIEAPLIAMAVSIGSYWGITMFEERAGKRSEEQIEG